MGAKFVHTDHVLPSLAELKKRASEYADRKYGVIHWVGAQVFFGCEYPEHGIELAILFTTILETAERAFPGIDLSQIRILIGVDGRDGVACHELFLDGEEDVEFKPWAIREMLRLRMAH